MRYQALLSGTLIALLLSSPVLAQEEEEEKRSNFVCRPQVYSRLVKAQEALQANKYEEAAKQAKAIQRRMRLNDHEKALVLQTLGYVYAGQEKLGLAAKTLEETYNLNALPAATQTGMLFNIGQIHMADKNFKKAVQIFRLWMKRAKNPKATALYTVAAANYQIKDYKETIRLGRMAMKSTKKPKDSLLQLLLSSYVETKDYRSAVKIISMLVERHPEKKNNWLQLAAMYSELNQDKKALAVMQLAKEAGVLEKSDEYVQLSQRLLSEEIPYKAGVLLEETMKSKTVETDADTSKLLATAWMQSRDIKKAVPALDAAAKLAEDGELYVRLAQLELERERWKQAISASEKALRKGGIENAGQVHLLIGIAQVRLGQEGLARQAFERASNDRSSRKSALGWIKFLASSSEQAAQAGN